MLRKLLVATVGLICAIGLAGCTNMPFQRADQLSQVEATPSPHVAVADCQAYMTPEAKSFTGTLKDATFECTRVVGGSLVALVKTSAGTYYSGTDISDLAVGEVYSFEVDKDVIVEVGPPQQEATTEGGTDTVKQPESVSPSVAAPATVQDVAPVKPKGEACQVDEKVLSSLLEAPVEGYAVQGKNSDKGLDAVFNCATELMKRDRYGSTTTYYAMKVGEQDYVYLGRHASVDDGFDVGPGGLNYEDLIPGTQYHFVLDRQGAITSVS